MDTPDHIIGKTVQAAIDGCHSALSELSNQARPRLHTYIFRVTLDQNLTEDLVQETLLQMCRSIKDIKDPQAFWAWLYSIATRKVSTHYRTSAKNTLKSASLFEENTYISEKNDDSLATMAQRERIFKMTRAITKLKHKQRAVVSLRCFEQMEYSQIAEIMGTSELSTRLSFHRAKLNLRKILSKEGFDKAAWLLCIELFGNITGAAQANNIHSAIAASSVAAVGTTVALSGATTSSSFFTSALASLATIKGATLALLTTFSSAIVVNALIEKTNYQIPENFTLNFTIQGVMDDPAAPVVVFDSSSSSSSRRDARGGVVKGLYENEYYFPYTTDDHFVWQMGRWTVQLGDECKWRHDQNGTYYYHSGNKKVHIRQRNMWDFMTRRFPTDPPEFVQFLESIEGTTRFFVPERDLLTQYVIRETDMRLQQPYITEYLYDSFAPEILNYDNWLSNVEVLSVVDERDLMHQRGWTFFHISGDLGIYTFKGQGRIPFIYSQHQDHSPWLNLTINDQYQIADTQYGAWLAYNGQLIASFPPGTFFKGLSRPWTGLHTIDVIRRDCVWHKINFGYDFDLENAIAIINLDGIANYRVGLYDELIQTISYVNGSLQFSYEQELLSDLTPPELPETYNPQKLSRINGPAWLTQIYDLSLFNKKSRLKTISTGF